MTEKNSKHLIAMTVDTYKFYLKDYKLFRSAKVSEISTFTKRKELRYLGYGYKRINATAIVDKERLTQLNMVLDDFMITDSHSVVVEGLNLGNYIITDYEICGSDDDYIYEVKLNLCSLL